MEGSLATFTDFESDRTLNGAKGRVHAKRGTYLTGSESGVVIKGHDFAGYTDARSGRRLIYQLVVNDVPVADRMDYRRYSGPGDYLGHSMAR